GSVPAKSRRAGGRPEKARELARDGDRRHARTLAALAHPRVQTVEAVLRAPGDLEHVIGLAVLPVPERDADPRRVRAVPGGFDQEPARIGRASLGDRALAA